MTPPQSLSGGVAAWMAIGKPRRNTKKKDNDWRLDNLTIAFFLPHKGNGK
jgi:hypothetical protein